MRYSDFKIVEAEEDPSGRFDARINMDSFYRNMELLKNTTDPKQAPSDLEGIDAVVRLGYMGSVNDSVLRRLGTSTPTQTGFGGYYDGEDDELVIAWDSVFEPRQGNRLPGTSTAAHELRHRAFQIMSIDPRFRDLLPEELTTGIWSDGWGRNVDWRKYKIIPQREPYASDPIASTKGIMVVPEHAMIYAVQHRDILSHEKAEWVNNSVLGNRGPEYWRDLYRRVNEGVKTFFRQHFDARAIPAVYPSRGDRSGADNDIVNISPEMKAYYRSWNFLSPNEADNFLYAGLFVMATAGDGAGYSFVEDLVDIWEKGYLRDVDDWMKKHRRRLLALSSGFQVAIDAIEKTRPYWNLLDIRNFTDAQVRTIVSTPNRPTAPVVPVEPVTVEPTTANPTATPTTAVVPRGTSIGFIQYAQQNRYFANNKTLWEQILNSTNKDTLVSSLNDTVIQASMSGLRVQRGTKEYITLLPDVWDKVESSAARQVLVETYLGKVVFVK